MMARQLCITLFGLLLATGPATGAGAETPGQILKHFETIAGTRGSPAAGHELFFSTHSGGKPETPSCITCHTTNLRGEGRTRAGKIIAPMAVSANPDRLRDLKKVKKWLRRNCRSVLGRECTAREKADIIAFLASQ